MENINISDQEKTSAGWKFKVEVGEGDERLEYSVSLDRKYWQKLTARNIPPEDLVEKSFQFLLSKESKEEILPEFSLRLISTYFPEYEEKMRK